MYTITSRLSRTIRSAGMIAAACATAATLATAGPAHAKPVGGTGTPRGCPVVDENGHISYVPPGTIYLLFHCGTDGEWHWGLLTDDVKTLPKGDHPIDTPPVSTASVRTVATHAAGRS